MKKNRNKIKGSSNNTILPIIRDRVNINKDKDKGRKEIYRKVKMEDKVNNRAKKTNK